MSIGAQSLKVMLALPLYIALIGLILAWYYKKFHVTYQLAQKLPGPPMWPIIGNALTLLGKSPPELLKVLLNVNYEFKFMLRLMVGPNLLVLLSDPKDLEVLLGSQTLIHKSNAYDFIKQWLGTGLLLSTGQKWFQRRKIITPTFHFKILEQLVDIFDKHSAIFVKKLAQFKGQHCDIFPQVTLFTLDVICETAMGVELNAQTNLDSTYVKAVKEISSIISNRSFNVFMRNDFLFKMSKAGRRQREVIKILHEFTDDVIVARRSELKNKARTTEDTLNDDDNIGARKKLALLDVLLQSTIDGEPLSNLDIREEVDTFMFEGHDTTTSGISFILYCLANNPEVQQKAFDEIRSIFGDDLHKPATMNDLNELKYLDLVIKESLRLYPPVPFFSRNCVEDVEISSSNFFSFIVFECSNQLPFELKDGRIIPKGATLSTVTYFMGRNETLWKDPLNFIPERFHIDNLKIHPYGNVVFSAGPRNCIGQKFAMLEMKSTISKILRNFELSVAPGYEPILVAELILRSENGVILIMEDRKY